ncbi:MAG TPA: hypothetical protein VKE74_11910 [Gemmataceae bacterium]|nr:hypothetical protein [Gemmataceae bacterium]
MRMLRLIVTAAVLAPAVGCNWMKEHWGDSGPPRPRSTEKLPDVAPDRLVGYLNDRAARFHSVSYGDVRIQCSRVISLPPLEGDLVCSQPRSFRMVGQTKMPGAKFDLGSNEQQFWMYLQVPTEKPVYVYASHTDFAEGRASLPGDMPFEPDWVMQALGMMTFPTTAPDPARPYQVRINERERTYTLWWQTKTPTGVPIRKEIVFDGDMAVPPRPQVKRHVIKNDKDKLICSAEIKTAQLTSPGTGSQSVIEYPTRVVLRWEEQKFEMDLTLDKAQVNQTIPEEQARRVFSRPSIQNVKPIDLARYEYR